MTASRRSSARKTRRSAGSRPSKTSRPSSKSKPRRGREAPVPAGKTRRLAATLFITLDGVVEEPQKWSFAYWGDETQKFKLEETMASDALLLGRVTYEGFAAAWPGRGGTDPFANKFNSMPKYVATRTLKKLVLGKGKRLFDEGSKTKLKLVESKPLGKGVMKLVYRPAELEPKAGAAGKA